MATLSSSERGKAWREKNPNCAKEYREKRKEFYKQYNREWYLKHREEAIANAKQWQLDNREQANKNNLASYHRNKDANREKQKAWARANVGLITAKIKRRDLAKINRTPKWLSKDDIWLMQEMYLLSTARTKLTGFRWHVDHIIPLQGKTVSGLHVPTNLQVIPAIENIRKGNRYK